MHDAEQGEQEDAPRPTGFDDTLWAAEDFAAHAQSLIAAPRRFTVICAWCQVEGTRTVLREGDDTAPPSHGICERHQRALLEHAGICAEDLT